MIKVEHLTKRYGGNFALDDVSFAIEEGEIVGLLGPNGAGKSTTMNILTGFLSATSGTALVNGVSVLENPLEAKRQIGYLPEQPPLYPEMTVGEYLRFVFELKKVSLPCDAHLQAIMSVVKLEDVQNRLIRNLSKGYKQRVGIAAALVGDPPILIFDEPTVGLDPKQIIEVRNLLRTLAKRHTVILSTHILSEVQAVCERIIIINRGRIIANEKTADMTRVIENGRRFRARICGPAKEVAAALEALSGVNKVETLREKEGDAYTFLLDSEGSADVRKPVFYLCAEQGWPLVGFEAVGLDLEEVFLRMVDKKAPSDPKKRKKK